MIKIQKYNVKCNNSSIFSNKKIKYLIVDAINHDDIFYELVDIKNNLIILSNQINILKNFEILERID